MKLGLVILLVGAAGVARAEIDRYAVILGNNEGGERDAPLRYAEADAEKIHAVLREIGGFRPENILVLRGENVETVRRAIISMNDRVRRSPQAMLVVYYSGHADARALHLGRTALPIAELEPLVRGSAAAFRLLILDSCRSGALTRVKGGTPAAAFAIQMDQRLAGEGAVFLTSSSASEDAQESDELRGSFFTHFLVSGLLGAADADGDGDVALGEVYRYAYDNTLRETSGTWAGTQHPTFEYELKGAGDIVLTRLAGQEGARAQVRFPERRDYLLFAGSLAGSVVGEVAAGDAVRRLSLRPGRYFVRARGPDHLLEGELDLAAGSEVLVGDERLRRVEYARLVRKGAVIDRVDGVEAGAMLRTPLLAGQSACLGAWAGYVVELPRVSFAAGAGACRAGFANDTLTADVTVLDAGVRAKHVWDVARLAFDLGVSAGGALLVQEFDTRGQAPSRTTAALQLGAGAGATLDVGGGFGVALSASADTFFFRDGATEGAFRAHVGGTFRLGIGKRW